MGWFGHVDYDKQFCQIIFTFSTSVIHFQLYYSLAMSWVNLGDLDRCGILKAELHYSDETDYELVWAGMNWVRVGGGQ